MVKIIKSGAFNEVYINDRVEVPGRVKTARSGFREGDVYADRMRAAQRAKQGVKRLIWANYTDNTAFLTLTFSKAWATDYDLAVSCVHDFFKRMSYSSRKTKKNIYKYLCVPEVQKKSKRWHFHILVFNWNYMDVNDISELWGNGGVDIRRVWGNAEHCANYVTKYFSKTFKKVGLVGKKRYSSTKNLSRSVVFKSSSGEGYFQNFKFLGYREVYRYVAPGVEFIYSLWVLDNT